MLEFTSKVTTKDSKKSKIIKKVYRRKEKPYIVPKVRCDEPEKKLIFMGI